MTCSSHFGVPSGDQLYLVIPNHPRNPDEPVSTRTAMNLTKDVSGKIGERMLTGWVR